jgi:SCY1-like protein 1
MVVPRISAEGRLVNMGFASNFGLSPLLAFLSRFHISHNFQVALAFVNDSCSSTHGKICVNAIFISPSGEWKLGGFELFSNKQEDASTLYV